MAKKTGNSKVKEKPNADKLIALYMEYVLVNEKMPKSVYKFAMDNEITEQDFYQFFGSFKGLRTAIWDKFFENSIQVMERSKEYATFSNREKLLTFYYTFFEVLTANRSYVLYVLREHESSLKNMEQLKGLRRKMKSYATALIEDGNREKSMQLFQQNEMIFSEGVWVQFLFLLKFWMDDNSPAFESTDVAIEKSVNTVFDLFDNTPLERVVDLGKFLWKERMA